MVENSIHDKFKTEYWQCLAAAKRYVMAARVLVESAEYRASGNLYLPALQLTAHGLELLLKSGLIHSGWTMKRAKKEFGHDLLSMWQQEENEPLRQDIIRCAHLSYRHAALERRWNDEFSDDPGSLISKCIKRLSRLHGRETDYFIRYPVGKNLEGPRVPFLVYTLEMCVEDRIEPFRKYAWA